MIADIHDIIKIGYENRDKFKRILKSSYLDYDSNALCKYYSNEKPILGSVPYTEAYSWLKTEKLRNQNTSVRIRRLSNNFELASSCEQLKHFRSFALKEYKDKKGPTRNSDIIRLNNATVSNNILTLSIQKAKWYDQVQSNLMMDWEGDHPLKEIGINTLRAFFLAQFDNSLPPLSDKRLVNSIGISTILFYRNSIGDLIPYLPRRTKSIIGHKKALAVFEGGYHCSSSGAVEWNDNEIRFEKIFIDDMYREIKEEIGVSKNEIEILKPLALCREFLRGGKPQIFFAGITSLNSKDLAKKRKDAIKLQKEDGKIEIDDKQLVINDYNEFKDSLALNGLTIEAVANLYYASHFLKDYI